MPPPARPAGQGPNPQPAAQVGDQKPQDGPSADKPAVAQVGDQKPQDGPVAAVESLPAQIARPVIRSVVLSLGQVFRLDPAELKALLEKITD